MMESNCQVARAIMGRGTVKALNLCRAQKFHKPQHKMPARL